MRTQEHAVRTRVQSHTSTKQMNAQVHTCIRTGYNCIIQLSKVYEQYYINVATHTTPDVHANTRTHTHADISTSRTFY